MQFYAEKSKMVTEAMNARGSWEKEKKLAVKSKLNIFKPRV